MENSEFSMTALRSKLASSKESGSPILLSIADIEMALSAFISREINEEEIARWAEFYDANDAVVFESNEIIPDVVFEISSPEINGWLDEARARKLLLRLTGATD